MEIWENRDLNSNLEPSYEQNDKQCSAQLEASAVIQAFNRLQEILSAVVEDSHSYEPINDKLKKYLAEISNIQQPEEQHKKELELSEFPPQILKHLLSNTLSQKECLQTLHEIVNIIEDTTNIRKIKQTFDNSGVF